jgi:hypothetical protein
MAVTIKDLRRMSQPELEQLFNSSPVGDIPNGKGTGTALFVFGIHVGGWPSSIIRFLAWQGKVFTRDPDMMINSVSPFRVKALKAGVYKAKRILGDGDAIIVDYSQTSIFTRATDELREVAPSIYLGNALWGKKRMTIFALEL